MFNAKVGLFEDKAPMREMLTNWLNLSGHEVVLEAGSLAEAIEAIEAAKPYALEVALVDADLGLSPNEGSEVAKKLREKMGSIAIIGISSHHDKIQGADTNIPKGQVEKIVEYIHHL